MADIWDMMILSWTEHSDDEAFFYLTTDKVALTRWERYSVLTLFVGHTHTALLCVILFSTPV